jgi:hypothetical protein
MNTRTILTLVASAALHGAAPLPLGAQESAATPATPQPAKKSLPPSIVYHPPQGPGGPGTRAAIILRTGRGVGVELSALAPEHEALTTQEHPVLFWYQSAPLTANLQVALVRKATAHDKSKVSSTPIVVNLENRKLDGGFGCVNLARYNVAALEPDVSYEWKVAIIPFPDSPAKSVVARGFIKRVEAPAPLADKLKDASRADRALAFAEAGYFYDSVQELSYAMAEDPKNIALHQLRASLLGQVKLPEAAAADAKLGAGKN